MQVSAGKLWSLRRLSDERGFFTMVAVDQRPGIEQLVRERHGSLDWAEMGKFKRLLIEEFSPYASALLVDPQYAYPYAPLALDPRRGLLVTLEQFACEEDAGGRRTALYPGWSVAKVKRHGRGWRQADALVPARRFPRHPGAPARAGGADRAGVPRARHRLPA